MRHGVLFYEAMGLSVLVLRFRFGVLFYEATRSYQETAKEARQTEFSLAILRSS